MLLAVGVAALVALAGARGLAAPHGADVTVLVAAEDLPVGADLADPDALITQRWPADLVPPAATADAAGVLGGPLPAGAVLTEPHIAGEGVGALAGPGRAAVPLQRDLLPVLPIGARLQVVTTEADGTGRLLSGDAEVVAADDEALWVAVADDAAGDLAAAGLRGSVAVTVLPP